MYDRLVYTTVAGISAYELYHRGYYHHHLLMRVFAICQFAAVATGCMQGAPWTYIAVNIALPIACWALYYAYDAELKKMVPPPVAAPMLKRSTKRKLG